jgi:EAL domain-containing protein (putative c-di-GMP-specific phosphodiesterase class I)
MAIAARPSLPVAATHDPSPTCGRCEQLPVPPVGHGVLHLWFPMGHTRGRAMQWLREHGWTAAAHADDHVTVRLDAARLPALVGPLVERLSGLETEDTRALFKPEGGDPTLADVARVEPLGRLAARSGSAWLLDLLAERRLTCAFQPIVHAADPTRIFAQEALLRGLGRDGELVPPGRMFGAARDAGLLFQLDLAARRTAIGRAVEQRLPHVLFVNFTPTAIYDPATCLRTTVRAIDDGGIPHEHVVFEVIESERSSDVAHLRRILAFYRDAGFRVALDDVGAGYSSLNLLHQLRPDFVKLDMELMRGVHADPYKAMIAAKLLELAHGLGIETVAEGIETAEELAWARDHGATYAQGYLLARPSLEPVRAIAG